MPISKEEVRDLRLKRALRKKIIYRVLLGTALAAVLFFSLQALSRLPSSAEKDVLTMCVQHGGISMHIHPQLSIFIKGRQELIPDNVGVNPACMRPIHTHDETGTIHLEFPTYREVKLGEFFRVWGKPFKQGENIKMIVNGKDNYEFENYIMRDLDKIEIYYE